MQAESCRQHFRLGVNHEEGDNGQTVLVRNFLRQTTETHEKNTDFMPQRGRSKCTRSGIASAGLFTSARTSRRRAAFSSAVALDGKFAGITVRDFLKTNGVNGTGGFGGCEGVRGARDPRSELVRCKRSGRFHTDNKEPPT
jgi:hypothetical protein